MHMSLIRRTFLQWLLVFLESSFEVLLESSFESNDDVQPKKELYFHMSLRFFLESSFKRNDVYSKRTHSL